MSPIGTHSDHEVPLARTDGPFERSQIKVTYGWKWATVYPIVTAFYSYSLDGAIMCCWPCIMILIKLWCFFVLLWTGVIDLICPGTDHTYSIPDSLCQSLITEVNSISVICVSLTASVYSDRWISEVYFLDISCYFIPKTINRPTFSKTSRWVQYKTNAKTDFFFLNWINVSITL